MYELLKSHWEKARNDEGLNIEADQELVKSNRRKARNRRKAKK